jgi:ABC-type nickel/cobalt efflux system permease component RcnA
LRRIFVALAIISLSAALASAESPNPFTSSGGPSRVSAPALGGIAALAPLLRTLTDRLAGLTREIRDAKTPGPILALALISLIYGVFHSLGPGHGKTIVSTFFLAKDAKLGNSLAAGYLIALVHAVSALSIVLVLYYLVRGIFSAGFESASRIVQVLSFGAIALIGAVMLVRRILGVEHSHRFGHAHEHEHESSDEEAGPVTLRELLGIALASGVVPCPGASAIILLSLSLNIMVAGVVSVVMISFGMGLTVTVVGAAAILAKRGVMKVSTARRGGGLGKVMRRVVEIFGSTVLFLFGLVFFIAQF